VLLQKRFDQVAAQVPQGGDGARLILSDQPRISDDVGYDDGCKTAGMGRGIGYASTLACFAMNPAGFPFRAYRTQGERSCRRGAFGGWVHEKPAIGPRLCGASATCPVAKPVCQNN
jgi:hypothetical protein